MNSFLHVDLDAFFASVEQLDHPEYRGKPVIVGGLPGDRRSVVSTASYEARKYGVHSALPTVKALELCPNGIFVRGRMHRYQEKSAEVMAVFAEFSPDVQQMSVDEAFIDLTGTERLFGPPEETAKRLKKLVLERTGLTVSVGLATNKYLAKIASGLSKPDGFYIIPPGSEESFMLSLPLEKVWGIGAKTLDHLHSAGFYKTAQIHDASLPLLKSIFGEAGANFMYMAVRGQCAESFSSESKTHSISAETTFPYDLVDLYTAETAILELSYTIMFRMMREGFVSRTVHIKIRYDDFSVHSAQETSQELITSTDNLFERATSLFRKTLIDGRGIRLLGVAAFNLERSTTPQQAELFDFDNTINKQAVEKAVLSIQQKHPESKVTKARLLKNSFRFLFIPMLFTFLSFLPSNFLFAQNDKNSPTPDKALLQYEINDTNIEFFTEGTWEAELTGSHKFTFQKEKAPIFDINQIVFKQTVDLSTWLMIDNHWYFEVAFADGFEKNTIAAGWYGEGIINHVRIANRGITFPTTYADEVTGRSIGGGQNESPGVSATFIGGQWDADFAFRYDTVASNEKTYSGMNEISSSSFSLSTWEKGRQFNLPSQQITSLIDGVYIETTSGTYTDSAGRKYKKLDSADYLIQARQHRLVIKEVATGAVCISFASSDNGHSETTLIKSQLGTFEDGSDPDGNGSGTFLGNIQSWFGSKLKSDSIPHIRYYSYGVKKNNDSYPETGVTALTGDVATDGFFTEINGQKVLLIQNPPFFSPFTIASYYDTKTTVSSSITGCDTRVVSSSTGITTNDYGSMISLEEPSSKKTYLELYNTKTLSDNSPAIYYPAADSFPFVYLEPGATETIQQPASDLIIVLDNYSSVPVLNIGTQAIPGTIIVYRDNVTDSSFSYDHETGILTLLRNPSPFEKIRITWYEESTSKENSSITGGAGFRYYLTDKLTFDTTLTTRWSYSPDVKSTIDSQTAPAFVSTAFRLIYDNKDFKLSNTASISLDIPDITGLHYIENFEGKTPETVYLSENAAINVPSSIVPVLGSREYETYPTLNEAERGDLTTPVTKKDSEISGYAAILNWNFTTPELVGTSAWDAIDLNLGSSASSLRSASQFSIALKDESDVSDAHYEVFLQLGVQAVDNRVYENQSGLAVWKVSKKASDDANPADVSSSFIPGKTGWQTITVNLSDSDRVKLDNYQNARIIVVQSKTNPPTEENQKKGKLLTGPFELNGITYSSQKPEFLDLEIRHQSSNQDLNDSKTVINWREINVNAFTSNVVLSRFISPVRLSSYRTINFTIESSTLTEAATSTAGIEVKLDRPEVFSNSTAFRLVLSPDFLVGYSQTTHNIEVNLSTKKVYMDGTEITSKAGVLCEVNTAIQPTRLSLLIISPNELSGISLPLATVRSGTIKVGTLLLKETVPSYILGDTLSASWKKTGTLLGTEKLIIFSNPEVAVNGIGSVSADHSETKGLNNAYGVANGDISASITTLGLKSGFKMDGGIAAIKNTDGSSKPGITQFTHDFTTTPEHIVFKIFTFSDSYVYSPATLSLKKQNTAKIDLNAVSIPVTTSFSGRSESSPQSLSQLAEVSIVFSFPISKASYAFNAQSSIKQQVPLIYNRSALFDTNYGQGWYDVTKLEFSNGYENASSRQSQGALTQTLTLPVANLSPSLNFTASASYTKGSRPFLTDSSSFILSIPFILASNKFTFSWTKKSGAVSVVSPGGIYSSDIAFYGNSVQQQPWLFTSIPIYDLFSTNLSDKITSSATSRLIPCNNSYLSSLVYNSLYQFSWSRPFAARISDLYIPSSATLSVARDITSSSSTSDIHNLKTTIGFTALNTFGKLGSKPIFTWFEQDEITHSWSLTLNFNDRKPTPSQVLFSAYLQLALFIRDKDNIKSKAELQIHNGGDWKTSETISWERVTVKSPIIAAITFFAPKLDISKTIFTRTNGLTFTYQQKDAFSEQVARSTTGEFSHLFAAAVGKYLTLKAKCASSITVTTANSETVTVIENTATLSGKISF